MQHVTVGGLASNGRSVDRFSSLLLRYLEQLVVLVQVHELRGEAKWGLPLPQLLLPRASCRTVSGSFHTLFTVTPFSG